MDFVHYLSPFDRVGGEGRVNPNFLLGLEPGASEGRRRSGARVSGRLLHAKPKIGTHGTAGDTGRQRSTALTPRRASLIVQARAFAEQGLPRRVEAERAAHPHLSPVRRPRGSAGDRAALRERSEREQIRAGCPALARRLVDLERPGGLVGGTVVSDEGVDCERVGDEPGLLSRLVNEQRLGEPPRAAARVQ
eukprot:scaffold19252_cov117-Isochrysis_galbana.AAC.3